MKKTFFKCLNCNNKTHSYKECKEPTTSWGIILVNYNNVRTENIKPEHTKIDLSKIDYTDKKNRQEITEKDMDNVNSILNNINFLLISRKHSLGYSEFIKGEYKVDKTDQIKYLFKQMKKSEIEKIKNSLTREDGFEILWKDLWRNRENKLIQRKKLSLNNYNLLKNDDKIDGPYINLKILTEKVSPEYDNDEWGFPKGRKNRNEFESDIDCAIREFNEETGYTNNDYKIIEEIEPLVEDFVGTNGISYRHIYFVAEQISDKKPENNITESQKDEIGNIMFMNFQMALDSIRKYHISRKLILEKIFIYYIDKLIVSLRE